ncbi:unnamed protein product [Choristocarpus tenellus]
MQHPASTTRNLRTSISGNSDIVSACFALPYERRLVLGMEDGHILLVNYITGLVLDKCRPHTSEVTQIIYCGWCKTIISSDYSGGLAVTSEVQCKLKELHVWGFQYLDLIADVKQKPSEPATGLDFLDQYSLIFLGDLTSVGIWHLDMDMLKVAFVHKIRLPATKEGITDTLTSIGVHSWKLSNDSDFDSYFKHTKGSEDEEDDDISSMRSESGDVQEGGLGHETKGGDDKRCEQDYLDDNEYSDGKATIALGTDNGQIICWTVKNILDALPHVKRLKIRAVPDADCPALLASFNPFTTTVKPRVRILSHAPILLQAMFFPMMGSLYHLRKGFISKTSISECNNHSEGGGEDANTSFEYLSTTTPEYLPHTSLWQAHIGPVSTIKSVTTPPCFYSQGEDGYQRSWSLSGEMLGQFTLPNTSEHQVRTRLFRNPQWRFFVNSVQVQGHHEMLTHRLLKEAKILESKNDSHAYQLSMARAVNSSSCNKTKKGDCTFYDPEVQIETAGVHEVNSKNNTAKRVKVSDIKEIKRADTTSATGQAEMEVMERQIIVEESAQQPETSEGHWYLNNESSQVSPLLRQLYRSESPGTSMLIDSHNPTSGSVGSIGGQHGPRKGLIGRHRGCFRPQLTFTSAFSNLSVRRGVEMGFYGREEYVRLDVISKNKSRVAAYNRIVEQKQGSSPAPMTQTMRLLHIEFHLHLKLFNVANMCLSTQTSHDIGLNGERENLNKCNCHESTVTTTSSNTSLMTESQSGAAPTTSPPSRQVQMYKHAAKEFSRGHSAGQTMWRDIQSESVSTKSRRSYTRGKSAPLLIQSISEGTRLPLFALDLLCMSDSTGLSLPSLVGEEDSTVPFKDEGDHRKVRSASGNRKGECSLHTVGQGGRSKGPTSVFDSISRDSGRGLSSKGSITTVSINQVHVLCRGCTEPHNLTIYLIKKNAIMLMQVPFAWEWDWCSRPVSAIPAEHVNRLMHRVEDESHGETATTSIGNETNTWDCFATGEREQPQVEQRSGG